MAHARRIKLISLFDDNVVEIGDNGLDRNGSETQSRSQARAMLSKRREVGGRMLPVFAVVERPKVLALDDPFDADFVLDRASGEFTGPSPAWLAEREKQLAARGIRQAAAVARFVGPQGVSPVAASVATGAPSSSKPKAEKGGAA